METGTIIYQGRSTRSTRQLEITRIQWFCITIIGLIFPCHFSSGQEPNGPIGPYVITQGGPEYARPTLEIRPPSSDDLRPTLEVRASSASGVCTQPSSFNASSLPAGSQHVPETSNFNFGAVVADLKSGMGLEFNDNIKLSSENRESDLILRPWISMESSWQVTQGNRLDLRLGLSYNEYLNSAAGARSGFAISPNSALSFDVFAGDFRFNFHDRFAYLQDPSDEITLSNVATFTRFTNTAGVSVEWNLNQLVLRSGYDHFNLVTFQSAFDRLNRSEEQFTSSATLRLNGATNVGLEATGSLVDYRTSFNNDGTTVSAGPFVEMLWNPYLTFRVAGGYQGMHFDSGGMNQDTSDLNSYYANISAVHQWDRYITQTLTAGHEASTGLQSNSQELNYVRYNVAWKTNSRLSTSVDGFFEDVTESGGLLAEKAQRYGGGVTLSYTLSRRLRTSLQYQVILKDSDLQARDYHQNRILFSVDWDL